jgi:hypothetical protein
MKKQKPELEENLQAWCSLDIESSNPDMAEKTALIQYN